MFTEIQVSTAIENAKPGINKYLGIMKLLDDSTVNVETSPEFRKAFNGFYKVRRYSTDWYNQYYGLMQSYRSKGIQPGFDQVLDEMYQLTGNLEASFSSKLVHTLNPGAVVWDKYVLANTGLKAPPQWHDMTERLQNAKVTYVILTQWFADFTDSDEGRHWIKAFDELIPEHSQLTDLKKIDFILWQLRD
jgi:hypothetical protein